MKRKQTPLPEPQALFLDSLRKTLEQLASSNVDGRVTLSVDNPSLPSAIWPDGWTVTSEFQYQMTHLCESFGYFVRLGLGTFKYSPPKIELFKPNGPSWDDLEQARALYSSRPIGTPVHLCELYRFIYELGAYSVEETKRLFDPGRTFKGGPSIGARLVALLTLPEREKLRNSLARHIRQAPHLLPIPGIMTDMSVVTANSLVEALINSVPEEISSQHTAALLKAACEKVS